MRICPHCNHLRKPGDQSPDWQCPACQRAYAKAASSPAGGTVIRQVRADLPDAGGGIGKWVLLAGLVGGGYLALHTGGPGGAGTDQKVSRQAGAKSRAQPAVTLYATSWCGYCAASRDFFATNGIVYTELDIERSTEGAEGHRKLNGNGVPLIVVGDSVIRGFDEGELRSELRPWLKKS